MSTLRRTLQRQLSAYDAKDTDLTPKPVPYEKFIGIDLVDDNTNLPTGLVPYAEGANFGKEVGSCTKWGAPTAVFGSLGAGGIDGAAAVDLIDGQHLLFSHGGKVYDCGASTATETVDTDAEWNAGSGTSRVAGGKLLLPNPTGPTFSRASVAYKSDGAITEENDDPVAGMLSASGLIAFDAARAVDDVVTGTGAWHTDTSIAGAYLQIDLGSGNEKAYTKARLYAMSAGSISDYSVRYSDNGTSWFVAASGFVPALSGWNEKTWASSGAHRYWQLYLTNTPGSGSWISEMEWFTQFDVPRFEITTINLLTENQASAETDETGFSAEAKAGGTAVMSRVTTEAWHGSVSMLTELSSGSTTSMNLSTENVPVAIVGDHTYTMSAWVKAKTGSAGKQIRINMGAWSSWPGGSRSIVESGTSVTLTSVWQRITVTGTAPLGPPFGSSHVFLQCEMLNCVAGDGFYADGFQIENRPYASFWQLPSAVGTVLMMEEGTTNLLSANQSSVETDLTGFDPQSSATLTRDISEHWHDAASLKIVTPGVVGGEGAYIRLSSALANTDYTGSVWLKGSGIARIAIRDVTNGVYPMLQNITLTSTWTRYSVSLKTGPLAVTDLRFYVYTQVAQAITFYADGLQLEQKPYATSWVLGGVTRAAETLAIPTSGVLTKAAGAVELCYIPQNIMLASNHVLFDLYIDANNRYVVYMEHSTGLLYGSVLSSGTWYNIVDSTPLTVGQNYPISFSWDGSVIRLCKAGSQVGSDTAYVNPVGSLPASAYIGCAATYDMQANGIIDDLRISSRARTLAEHQAYVSSGQPYTWDEYTTYLLPFDGSLEVAATRKTQWTLQHDLGSTPSEASFAYDANVPSGQTLTKEYATSPDGSSWSSWQDLVVGAIGLARYISTRWTLTGTDLTTFYVDSYEIAYTAELSAPQEIYSGLSPGAYVCFTSYANRAYFCAGGRAKVYDGTSVRNVGVDPPAIAPTLAAGAAGTPNGAYKGKVTFVNTDNVESNPSPEGTVTVTSQKITWTVPTGPTGTAKRRLYRTKAGGSVYYLVTTLDDNTTTSYTDNTADSTLVTLMDDDNNIPPDATLVYACKDYMFYVSAADETQLWFSKPGRPEQVPNITDKQFYKQAQGQIKLLRLFNDALLMSGPGFTQAIYGNVFTTDLSLDNTTVKHVDSVGALSHEAASICVDPRRQRVLAMILETGELASITPGLQEQSLQAYPASRDVSPVFRQAVLRGQAATAYFGGVLYVALAWQRPGAPQVTGNNVLLCYDFAVQRWQGIINTNARVLVALPQGFYLASGTAGVLNRLSESQFTPLVLDSAYQGNTFGVSNFVRVSGLRLIVSEGSVTTNAVVKVKVDGSEYSVAVGSKDDWGVAAWSGGDYGYGRQDAVVSPRFPVYLPVGKMFGWRLEDPSESPLTVYAVVLEIEPVYFAG